ncbi:probable asparagine--tRNA ligase, mitochondrial [Thrips palmi]|uniref:asparagine--tRNA ligase n=1 Tax=Thrips palmi TaxID=161013 RepID=A0A6P8YKF6_THRPL|nr:probable asparagine--tRNA ligase, mitochondrial [Thrips palmi]
MSFLRRCHQRKCSAFMNSCVRQNCRSFTKIAALLESKAVGSRMTVQGWVKSKRKMKLVTFIDVSDGSSSEKLQIAVTNEVPPQIDVGASVKVDGIVQSFGKKGQIELLAESVELIGPCNLEDGYPFAPRKTYSMEYIRQKLLYRPRTNLFSSVLRLRSNAATAFRNHLNAEGFYEVNAPILTSSDCEGAGEVFSVKPNNQELLKQMAKEGQSQECAFFNSKVYLSVSGQMHLEAAVRGLSHVYTFGPTFRAENSKSRLHLAEFYMLEAEEILYNNSIETVISTIEKMLRNVTQCLLDSSMADLESVRNVQIQQKKSARDVVEYEADPLDVENIQKTFLSSSPYTIMTYREAMDILSSSKNKFKSMPKFEDGLTKEHELYLVKHNKNRPIFVIEWPVHLKAFYMKASKDGSMVEALDLLVPIVGELCGGSVRENDPQILSSRMKKLGVEETLSWYTDLRRFGNVSTGGFGLGFERYLQCLLNITNIKDVTPFPRWPHNCQM